MCHHTNRKAPFPTLPSASTGIVPLVRPQETVKRLSRLQALRACAAKEPTSTTEHAGSPFPSAHLQAIRANASLPARGPHQDLSGPESARSLRTIRTRQPPRSHPKRDGGRPASPAHAPVPGRQLQGNGCGSAAPYPPPAGRTAIRTNPEAMPQPDNAVFAPGGLPPQGQPSAVTRPANSLSCGTRTGGRPRQHG